MIILGLDPGSRRIGYGVIEKKDGKTTLLDAGLLAVSASKDPEALRETKCDLAALLEKWRPERVAIEKLYFSKNQKTAIQVAQARGVLLAEASGKGIAILEFTPNEVKLNITGFGGADKKAVAKMVRLILNRPELDLIDDAMDALAIALVGSSALHS